MSSTVGDRGPWTLNMGPGREATNKHKPVAPSLGLGCLCMFPYVLCVCVLPCHFVEHNCMHVGLAQVVPGTLRSIRDTCMYSYVVLMFTDIHAHMCMSMWSCFRLLCLYVHGPVFEYGEHASVGRYGPHTYMTGLRAGHL